MTCFLFICGRICKKRKILPGQILLLIIILINIFKIQMKKSGKVKVKKLTNTPYAIDEGDPIGKGSFAIIKRAYNLQNPSQELVVKIISAQDQETAKTIRSQLQMLKELPKHPNLVNCAKVQISSQRNFYIIMQYCNQGNLEKYLYDHKNNLSEQKIWFFLKQFTDGYKVLYDRNIIHRDIKPENILIKNGNFKISDFGLSRIVENVEFTQNISAKGTPLYMAPQVHFEKEGNAKVDVFSLGIILYRLAFRGRYPFFNPDRTYHSINEYFKQLMVKKLTFPEMHNRSKQLIELIEKMLAKSQNQRICWKEIFEIERIKRAVRNERRKQIVPMEEFRKSLLVVCNSSIADYKFLDYKQENQTRQLQKQQVSYLTIEEAFKKSSKSYIEKKLYRNKLIYTLIDISNRRIKNTLEKERERIHPYIKEQLQKIILVGIMFCLSLIERLESISGDWQCITTGQILNFEDIFENDKSILSEKAKQFKVNPQSEKYKQYTYQILLYNLLIEYQDYPKPIKNLLRVNLAFLTDIYDLVVKIYQEKNLSNEEKTNIDYFQEEHIDKFERYLQSLQNLKQEEIVEKMKRMGLVFI